MSRNRFELTPEQLALAQERQEKRRLQKEQAQAVGQQDPRGQILKREWLQLKQTEDGVQPLRVMTWNMLAQTLIRRELFPNSDCLKASQREHMLYREIASHGAHVCCLQEVDRTEKLFPILERAGYGYVYKAGHKKKHGSLIAYRKDMFEKLDERVVYYDEEPVRPDAEGSARQGSSFFTKNIANLIALRRLDGKDQGFIVATTHLFWHPRYTYERARQAGILFREASKLREELGHQQWPCIVAGDFNFQPDDAAYALLVGDPLLPAQSATLAFSRVVHRSIDPAVPVTAPKEDDEGGDDPENDPDRVITNARPAGPADGLLDDDELRALFDRPIRPVSAYDEGLRSGNPAYQEGLSFGSRMQVSPKRHGAYEPVWTSYTHYWKTVLDYIFILNPPDRRVTVTSLAKPIKEDKLVPGLPRMGVCGSDHISLAAELVWEANPRT